MTTTPNVEDTHRVTAEYTVPSFSRETASEIVGMLQDRLTAYIDLALTLKHIHWNVVGPNFIGVHEMLDPQVMKVRGYVDDIAERIAIFGGEPVGTPGFVAKNRTWEDYSLGRDLVQAHLGALDVVYTGVLEDNRKVIERTEELDPVTHDMFNGHNEHLEMFQWFVRAHLEDRAGRMKNAGAQTEGEAADAARPSDETALAR